MESSVNITMATAVTQCASVNDSGLVEYCCQWNDTMTSLPVSNCTRDLVDLDVSAAEFERVVTILVPIIFGFIALIGFLGNLLVLIVVLSNHQMRNTTNLLILNLAFADLIFIVICVPFTAVIYAMPYWPFGVVFCKIYQYVIHVTAYVSVYSLVFMSLDRYLAVVHPIQSMSLRTERNCSLAILSIWVVLGACNVPCLLDYTVKEYMFAGEVRSACLHTKVFRDPAEGQKFYGCFFAFAYVLPLFLVCVLYGLMLKRLLYGGMRASAQSAEAARGRKRVTKLVVIVVGCFAFCWLPIQLILVIQYFGTYPNTEAFMALKIASNCLAYMNSCVNPILYAFLSDNFRKSFRKLLCWSQFQPVRLEYERTTAKPLMEKNGDTRLQDKGLNNTLTVQTAATSCQTESSAL